MRQLKKNIEALLEEIQEEEAATNRVQGMLDVNMKELADEFDCTSLKQAKQLLEEKKKKYKKIKKGILKHVHQIEKNYGLELT